MMATIWPGSTACAAGAVTWASTFPTHTAMPSGSPVQAAARAREAARPGAERGDTDLACGLVELGVEVGEVRVQRGQERA